MSRLNIFVDTEFTDFVDLGLISIALVANTDPPQEYYVEITDFDRTKCNDFVVANVLPNLNKAPGRAMLYDAARDELREWLEQFRDANAVICYDFVGDYVLLQELLYQPWRGSEFAKWPAWLETNNIYKQLEPVLLLEYWRDHPEYTQHHALHDARSNRAAYVGGGEPQKYLDTIVPRSRAR